MLPVFLSKFNLFQTFTHHQPMRTSFHRC